MGYLTHLHTSSGRVPTKEGYEKYINELMRERRLTAKEKDVIVFIAQVYDKNQDKMSYADLIRYDFDTHKELFHAVIYRGGTSWGYKTQEFSFSRP